MASIRNILTGWLKATGVLRVSHPEKKLSDLRLKLCGTCKFSQTSKFLEFVNGHANYESRLQCGKCKCPCLQKTLVVDENCPIQKW